MSRYTEIASRTFHFQTRATIYSEFANLVQPQEIAMMPSQRLRQRGICHIRILQSEQGTTVIASELPINPGKSITNAAEAIATQVVKRFKLDPTTTRFIEHYTQESFEGRKAEETFDEVRFTWTANRHAHHPQWRRLQPQEIAALREGE